VDFSNTSSGSIVLTTANSVTNGILTSAAAPNGVAYATVNGTNWAAIGAGNTITAYAAYQTGTNPAAWAATDNVSLSANPSASLNDTTINSLRFSDSSVVTLNAAKTLTLGTGGLLVTGTGANSISGGTLKGSGGTNKELVVIQNNVANPFAIGSVITDNGGATALTKAGVGTLNLTGANTYSGATNIPLGTLVVGAGGTLGTGALNLGGATTAGNLDLSAASSTVAALNVVSNTATANTISIGSGQTLTVNGNVIVNDGAAVNGHTTSLTVTGGGALSIGSTGGTFVVSEISNAANSTTSMATLDLSGLANFSANYGATGKIGIGTSTAVVTANGPNGTLLLAANNSITAGTLFVSFGSTNAGKNTLRLGTTNTINVDALGVGLGKGPGTLNFEDGLTNPAVVIRGSAGGASRVVNFRIGDYSDYTAGGASTASTGNVNFTASGTGPGTDGSVDALIGNLIIGTGRISGQDGGTGTASGTLSFDLGTIDATSIVLGRHSTGTAAGASATGTLNLGGTGALIVGTGGMEIAHRTAGAPPAVAITGNLNLNGGTSNVTLNSGIMNMGGKGIGTAAGPITTIMLNGGTVSNAGSLAGKNITINAGVVFSGTPAIAVTDGGSLTNNLGTPLTVSGISGGGTAPGIATSGGDVIVAAGSQIAPGSTTMAGTLLFSNNLTINGGSGTTAKFKLSDAPGSGDAVTVTQSLTLNGITNIQIGILGIGPQINSTYTLFTYSGTLTGNETNFNVLGPGSRTTFTIVPTSTTLGQINLAVGGTAPFALAWKGDVNSTWDLNNTANWRDGSNTAQKFFNLDTVTFDDTSTNLNDVQITGTLSPGSVTVNANRNYKFTGTGNIASGNLVKSGNGTLIIANNNTYSGTTDINGGVLQIGDGGTTGSLEQRRCQSERRNAGLQS
jgi:autotransporter-associated beta strand protein